MEDGGFGAYGAPAGRVVAGGLEQARVRADAQARKNAAALTGVARNTRPTLEQRAKRLWDLPAKVEIANRIADEELARAGRHHNDERDAWRHATWSRRTADAAGPMFTRLAGLGHEVEGLLTGQPLTEAVMDMINNDEGRRASIERRPINRTALQMKPIGRAEAERSGKYVTAPPQRGAGR